MTLNMLALVLLVQGAWSAAVLGEDYREAEITAPIASVSSTRRNVGFRGFGPDNGVDGDFLTWVHTVAFEQGKDAWWKLDLGTSKSISKILVVNRYWDQLAFSGFMCGLTEEYYVKDDCVMQIDGVTVSVYNGDELVHECGTIEGRTGKAMEDQFYYVDCDNAEGDTIMLTRGDVISFTDLVMYQYLDGIEVEIPIPKVSMNTWRPVDLQDGHDFTAENAVDRDMYTFIHTIVNPRVENYFKFEIGVERSVSRVEVVNRFFEQMVSMHLPCGLMAFYSDTFCVGHIYGLRAEIWSGDSRKAGCGSVPMDSDGESMEDQTFSLDCEGAVGDTVMLIRKIIVVFTEMRVYERIDLHPDPNAPEAESSLTKSVDLANWTMGTGGLISAGFRPHVTGNRITKR